MTKEEVIALADKTGLFDYLDLEGDSVGQLILQNFAALVAAHEREECAQIAEEWLGPTKDRELHIAAAIRSRTCP